MEIIVHSSSENVKTRVHNVAMFYAALIRLQRFTSTVNIRQMRGLYKNIGAYGETNDISHMGGGVEVLLDANLPFSQLLSTLAHEMVHSEQFHENRLMWSTAERSFIWNAELSKNKGTTYSRYRAQPWEIEAFERQDELANLVIQQLNI
jgi:hypothetical protein